MKEITLITGNHKKAEYFMKHIGVNIEHINIDLDELQSLDLEEIIVHKVKQAYDKIKKPVLVEDISLEFKAFGKLPGPFIKFFLKEMNQQDICDLLKDKTREAVIRCLIGYYDGTVLKMFEGNLEGTIALNPAGDNGFGFDKIFIPNGHKVTRAEFGEEEYADTYLKIRRLDLVKKFIELN